MNAAVAEAVSEVKRQAVAELRKAVAESELKASQVIATERARLDSIVAEARKQAVDEILLSIRAPHEATEVCCAVFVMGSICLFLQTSTNDQKIKKKLKKNLHSAVYSTDSEALGRRIK